MQGINTIKMAQRAITSLDIDIPWKPCRGETNKRLILLLNVREGVHPSLNGCKEVHPLTIVIKYYK